jgi:hypothetical protein
MLSNVMIIRVWEKILVKFLIWDSETPELDSLLDAAESFANLDIYEDPEDLLEDVIDGDVVVLDLDTQQKAVEKLVKKIKKSKIACVLIYLANTLDEKKLKKHQKSKLAADLYIKTPIEDSVLVNMLQPLVEEEIQLGISKEDQSNLLSGHSEATEISEEVKALSQKFDSIFADVYGEDKNQAILTEAEKEPAPEAALNDVSDAAPLDVGLDGDDAADADGLDVGLEASSDEEETILPDEDDLAFPEDGDLEYPDMDDLSYPDEEPNNEQPAPESISEEPVMADNENDDLTLDAETQESGVSELELGADDDLNIDLSDDGEAETISDPEEGALDLSVDDASDIDLGASEETESVDLSEDGALDLGGDDLGGDDLSLSAGEDAAESVDLSEDGALDLSEDAADDPSYTEVLNLGETDLAAEAADDNSDADDLSVDLAADDLTDDLGGDDLAVDLGADDLAADDLTDDLGGDDLGVDLAADDLAADDLGGDDLSMSEEPAADLGGDDIDDLDDDLNLEFGSGEAESMEEAPTEAPADELSASDLGMDDLGGDEIGEEIDDSVLEDDLGEDELSDEALFGGEADLSADQLPDTPEVAQDMSTQAKVQLAEIDAMMDDAPGTEELDATVQEMSGPQYENTQKTDGLAKELNAMSPEFDPTAEDNTEILDDIPAPQEAPYKQDNAAPAQAIPTVPPVSQSSEAQLQEHREVMASTSEELTRLGETIKNLREDREKLLEKIYHFESEKNNEKQDFIDLQAELDERKIELNLTKKRYDKYVEDLKYQLDISQQKKGMLEEKNKQLEKEVARLSKKSNVDVNRIKARETELENKLDLLRADSEMQIKNRDQKILELKRRIDTLEFDIESMHMKEKKVSDSNLELEDKMERVIRTLRLAIGELEENDNSISHLERVKKNLDI